MRTLAATVLAALLTVTAVSAAQVSAQPDPVSRGAYLARVGNCAGCHTAPGGADYAGGRAIATPFGAVYGGNLTPHEATGLGRWSADDFWQALHHGRSRDGRRLAPAFPYTSYTHLSRDDSDALFAWLRSLAPVDQPVPASELRFPYGTQAALAAWQWLYFKPGAASATAAMGRGEYLVKALGHCTACHAPRNRWGAPTEALTGGEMPGHGWYAPSLHPQAGTPGTLAEQREALVDLLRSGRNAHTSASGPMAGVVMQSTQYWTDDDLHAAAAWLVSLPVETAVRSTAGSAGVSSPPGSGAISARGAEHYLERCADCHGRDGEGAAGAYPPLAGNPTVRQSDPRNLIRIVQHGVFGPTTAAWPRPYGMPPQDLNDADLAAVLSYIRQAWGNAAAAVTVVDVVKLR